MHYPYELIKTPANTVHLDANIQHLVMAMLDNAIIPYGDYGGDIVYYFSLIENGLGNIIYTEFDKATTIGLRSFMVRYGAATTVRQAIFNPSPKAEVPLKYIILPTVIISPPTGSVTP